MACDPTDPTCEPWPVSWPCALDDYDPDDIEAARQFASLMLWSLSGRRFGVCHRDERYNPACSAECVGPWKDSTGTWRNGPIGSDCCRLLLAGHPVVAIDSVTEWGVVLDPDLYDVSRRTWLRRRGGCWPCAADCDEAPLRVEYRAGWTLPLGTGLVVGEVACEVLAARGDGPCRLPGRALNVTRQGVSVQMADPATFTDNGLLGLPLADQWVLATNPNKLIARSRVYSPDLARRL